MEAILKMLEENDLAVNAWEMNDEFFGFPIVTIEIVWGDWKHEHLRCDHLMKQLGYGLCDENITEENGGDCYSAVRTYVQID